MDRETLNKILCEVEIKQNFKYFALTIGNSKFSNEITYELIINTIDHIPLKMQYINNAYDKNLFLKSNDDIKIVDCIVFNDFNVLNEYY